MVAQAEPVSSDAVAAEDVAVPSMTISITKDDIDAVTEASRALQDAIDDVRKRNGRFVTNSGASVKKEEKLCDRVPATSDDASEQQDDHLRTVSASDVSSSCSNEGHAADGNNNNNNNKNNSNAATRLPHHELVFQAAQGTRNPLLRRYLEKMKGSGATIQEMQTGTLLFHDMDVPAKFELIFSILAGPAKCEASSASDSERPTPARSNVKGDEAGETSLRRDGLVSLFRAIVMAISTCIHRNGATVQFEMDKGTEVAERPTKRVKVEHMSPNSSNTKTTAASTVQDSVPPLQSPSPSFDCSLATLKEEDDKVAGFPSHVMKEFQEIAIYAAHRVLDFSRRDAVGAEAFQRWRNAEGAIIAPWLALMQLSQWQMQTSSPDSPSIMPLSPSKGGINFLSTSDENHLLAALSPTLDPPTPSFAIKEFVSRTVVSFDFTGSMPADQLKDDKSAFCICITEENLKTFRSLVNLTGLAARPSVDICKIILDSASTRVVEDRSMKIMTLDAFNKCLNKLIPTNTSKSISKMDLDVFSSCFADFFGCYQSTGGSRFLRPNEADAQELAVGFCFLCAGNKSSKLATGFELLEDGKSKGLTVTQLTQYLRSYLTMLVGISLLTTSPEALMQPKMAPERRSDILLAIGNGAAWTLGHYLKTTGRDNVQGRNKVHSFSEFASWYTSGGYNVAPWLELLDLSKLLVLIGKPALTQPKSPAPPQPLPPFPSSEAPLSLYSPRGPQSTPFGASSMPLEILYTFPLANQRSLVVLREDATYVRGVVEELGMLAQMPEEIWSALYSAASKKPIVPQYPGARPLSKSAITKSLRVSRATFLDCMLSIVQPSTASKKRTSRGVMKSPLGCKEILINFFHSFDLHQIDAVSLNELMGGITLLCGGKKSTKLNFAFGVFDRRDEKGKKKKKTESMGNSLGGEELFLFLRSFLIVMFSCCRQSWDLSDDAVGRYIADTANMVTDDVMRYQWRSKKDRVDFDEFGKWYNDGGYETAPWLELLDLKKWVLVDNSSEKIIPPKPLTPKPIPPSFPLTAPLSITSCPPAPSDEDMDATFFDNDNGIMTMDSMDEMDMILMQQQSHDADEFNRLARSFSFSPRQVRQAFPPTPRARPPSNESTAVKFHLVTDDNNGGYMISVSQKRILRLRDVLVASGLYHISGKDAVKQLLGDSLDSDEPSKRMLTKDQFDTAMRDMIESQSMSIDMQNTLSDLLTGLFNAFDPEGTGSVNGVELACGFTVLCKGKKSDKLEHAFDVISQEKKGRLPKSAMTRYLRSFLMVLMGITTNPSFPRDATDDSIVMMDGTVCDDSISTITRVVEDGSQWAVVQAFSNRLGGSQDSICFEEFAEWYTHVGYINIPWLELLDLHKWCIVDQ